MNSVIERMLVKGEGRPMLLLGNADGKEWLLPRRRMRAAMALYQPGSRRGKWLKRLLPFVHRLPGVTNVIHARRLSCRLSDGLDAQLRDIFGVDRLDFAIFGGTPCVHQKVTMQVSSAGRILGYAKLSDREEIAALMRHEADFLISLASKGVKGVPKCLYCGLTAGGLQMFVQSTEKSLRSRPLHHWTPLHDDFLSDLRNKTRQTVPFIETDFYRTLADFKAHLYWLPRFRDKRSIYGLLADLMKALSSGLVEVCASHGDFTPWNMVANRDSLFVFDWEYARMTAYPDADRYHFFTQSAIFERRWGVEEILGYIQSDKGAWINRDGYQIYLLDVLARYTLRERGIIPPRTHRTMLIWMQLIHRLRSM